MQAHIIRKDCCGHGACIEVAPAVFTIDSQQKAVVLDADAAAKATLIEAAESCPCQAIVIEDDEGNPVFP